MLPSLFVQAAHHSLLDTCVQITLSGQSAEWACVGVMKCRQGSWWEVPVIGRTLAACERRSLKPGTANFVIHHSVQEWGLLLRGGELA